MTASQSMTRLSIQTGMSSGSPNGVTPPIIMPVRCTVSSASANDALRVPSLRRTTPFTSSRVDASTTQQAIGRSTDLPTTQMALAEASIE